MPERPDRTATGKRALFIAGAVAVAIGLALAVGPTCRGSNDPEARVSGSERTSETGSSGQSPSRPAPLVEVERADARTIEHTLSSTGTLVAPESIVVTTEVAGRVRELRFEEGARVSADDVLVVLDRSSETAGLDEARANAREAERNLERQEALAELDVTSEARLDRARTREARARAALETASEALSDRTIEAPFDGVTGRRLVSAGALLEPGEAVTTLVEVRALDLLFSVPDRELPQLREGLRVRARSSAYPDRTFEGRVTFVGTEIDPATRSLPLEATLANDEGRLKPGMFMDVELVVGERDAITIPESALVNRGPASYAFVVDPEDVAHRVPVRPGVRRGGWIEIREGLESGQPVVVSGLQRVRDGQAVRTGRSDR